MLDVYVRLLENGQAVNKAQGNTEAMKFAMNAKDLNWKDKSICVEQMELL